LILYIASPYGARNGATLEELQANVDAAIKAGRTLISKGHNVHIPHLNHYVQNQGDPVCDEDRWLIMCLEWVSCCDGIVLLDGWQESRGCFCEYIEAKRLGLDIFHGVSEVPEA